MTIVRSLVYGYLGAVLGGLGVALVAVPFGISYAEAAGTAVPVGIVMGTLGLALPWGRVALARARGRR